MSYIGSKPADKALTGADIEDGTVQIADLAATGTKDSTTFLRGDGTFNGVASLSTASGSAPSYSARAWVNFNGTGTVAIREDGNVSSITDNGTGNYTVNFTNAMPDVNYCPVSSAGNDVGLSGIFDNCGREHTTAPTTTTYTLGTLNNNGFTDLSHVYIAFFR